MKNLCLILFLAASSMLAWSQPTIGLQQYATGFSNPVDIANCGDDRLFIVEQSGYIRIIDGQGNVKPQAFLDIDASVQSGGERGLLGLAFHPDYEDNGFFYVNYINNSGNTRISRFSVTNNPDIADPSSEEILLSISQPYGNHNGGNLEFGPDGYLYIGMGDGGDANDPLDYGQNPQVLLGKMLRIDVDTAVSYKIPPDNPYVNDPNVRDEIWAFGLRNPWRFSFDRLTGDMWIGDVGQGSKEEIDFQPASSAGGENYGWKCYEGTNTHLSSIHGCGFPHTPPVFDYARSLGFSVTGGYVYRGCNYPNLFGHYVFCDYGTGNFWTIANNGGTFVTTAQMQSNSYRYVTFGEDRNGELYAGGLNGTIYRVTETAAAALPSINSSGTSYCPGDSLSLFTQAGYASYEWLLNDVSIGSGLQISATWPGEYSLVATGNNGCVYTTPSVMVTELSAPVPVIAASANSFCEGDSLELTTGTFAAYSWSEGSTTQAAHVKTAGDYTVTVTDTNGCEGASLPFIVLTYALPQPVIQQTGDLCAGNSVTLSTGDYESYRWSGNDTTQQITVAQEGDYVVEVTDSNGCAGSDTFTVAIHTLPAPVLLPGNDITQCGDSAVELSTATSYDGYTWSTGDTAAVLPVTASGTYSVTVSDANGCEGISDNVSVEFIPFPPVTNIIQSSTASTVIYAEDSGYRYQWYADGILLPGDTSRQLNGQLDIEYTVELTDSNGCSTLSNPYQIIVNVVMENGFGMLTVQPNPFTSHITLTYTLSEPSVIRVRLLDAAGKEITRRDEGQSAGKQVIQIHTGKLTISRGVYFLEIQNGILRRTLKVVRI